MIPFPSKLLFYGSFSIRTLFFTRMFWYSAATKFSVQTFFDDLIGEVCYGDEISYGHGHLMSTRPTIYSSCDLRILSAFCFFGGYHTRVFWLDGCVDNTHCYEISYVHGHLMSTLPTIYSSSDLRILSAFCFFGLSH